MRLIRCETLKLEDFVEDRIPNYIILSHTWGNDEVTFQDLTTFHQSALAVEKPGGFAKLQGFCKQVLARPVKGVGPIQYCWIDTCCIDKTSSAELTEAINSMFNWYRNSCECFVYLSDVKTTDSYDRGGQGGPSFSNSKWWTRGWTLQELIAPNSLTFFNANWNWLGRKENMRLQISRITGIPQAVLYRPEAMYRCSVAQRMSWAALRYTTRTEDIAYSLMGLFNVNMPLLYGEGDKSFVRLQEEILKESTDHTIFAWFSKHIDGEGSPGALPDAQIRMSGVLATHPRQFLTSSLFRPAASPPIADMSRIEIMSTNVGLRLSLPVVRRNERVLGILSVKPSGPGNTKQTENDSGMSNIETWTYLALPLWPEPVGDGRLMRIASEDPFLLHKSDYSDIKMQKVYLCKTNWSKRSFIVYRLEAEVIDFGEAAFHISRCFFSTFPLRDLTVFEALPKGACWEFWRPNEENEVLLLL